MANRKPPQPVQAAPVDLPVHVVSVRLPENLYSEAKSCAALRGIAFNALLCVALADYLESKGHTFHSPQKTK